jgi:hypothetical protein
MQPIDNTEPHITAEVRLFRTDEGGRAVGILAPHFTCPMEIAGEFLTCRLYLSDVGRMDPGRVATVPIGILAPELARDKLHDGLRFKLWDRRFFAEGTVLGGSSI